MKIGVVSDTHSLPLPAELLSALQKVDIILHPGDFCTEADLARFTKIKDVKAVYGNMDDASLRKKLPEKQIFTLEGVRIGMFHGEGPAKRVPEFVQERFKKDQVDLVVFGHSHQPLQETIKGVLYFNPGSPNDRVHAPYCSYGIIEIQDGKILKSEIIKLKDK